MALTSCTPNASDKEPSVARASTAVVADTVCTVATKELLIRSIDDALLQKMEEATCGHDSSKGIAEQKVWRFPSDDGKQFAIATTIINEREALDANAWTYSVQAGGRTVPEGMERTLKANQRQYKMFTTQEAIAVSLGAQTLVVSLEDTASFDDRTKTIALTTQAETRVDHSASGELFVSYAANLIDAMAEEGN